MRVHYPASEGPALAKLARGTVTSQPLWLEFLYSPFAIGLELTDNRRCYAEELLSTNRNLRRDQRGPA